MGGSVRYLAGFEDRRLREDGNRDLVRREVKSM